MHTDQATADFFTQAILKWYDPARRPLPWKHIKDPYLIWLSEIILQQTRVEQGLAYYNKFKRHFPTVRHLAAASQDQVFKHWEGLGYYSRARNLHATAKIITEQYDAVFPADYKQLLKLKGVGPYTAAAIASFAFALPYAVVDGNVYRVLSRFFGDDTPIDTTEGKKRYAAQAQALLATQQAGLYNQSIMDFGATICTPKNALCSSCPLASKCRSLQDDKLYERPIKAKKLVRKTRYFHYFLLQADDTIVIQKRMEKDIWKDLYQLPLFESTAAAIDIVAQKSPQLPAYLKDILETQIVAASINAKQSLTHQTIMASFWTLNITQEQLLSLPTDFLPIKQKNWCKFAFPKIINDFFKNNL